MPNEISERSHRILKGVVKQNQKSSSVEIIQELQSSSGGSDNRRTFRRELKTCGFHIVVQTLTNRTSLNKMRIVDCNVEKLPGLWACKEMFFWWDELRFTI
ncbi:hypothetical protein TNCV_1630021 [Trichonephila clavipes]|uniref:Uncharacterized protein n=1 Tax=Trichonephila clavipes TaxID=2585209 RepID=A0A8X6VWG3_TRICX|nr:hypothetical protein TNCV_1630021 [Trichonephila clavipes]